MISDFRTQNLNTNRGFASRAIRSALFWALLSVVLPTQAQARLCREVYTKSERLISTEIELTRSPQLMALLQFKVPRVAEIIDYSVIASLTKTENNQPESDVFAGLTKQRWDQLPTKDLTPEQKQAVAVLSSLRDAQTDFFENRDVRSFEVTNSLTFTPTRDISFRGQSYQAGQTYTLNPRDFMWPKVEYASPDSVKGMKHLEIHFKNEDTTSTSDIQVFLEDILGVPTKSVSSRHSHIPFKRPETFINRMRRNGFSDQQIAVGLSLYYMKVNLAMMAQFAYGYSFHKNQGFFERSLDGIGMFGFLKREDLSLVLRFFENLAADRSNENDPLLKKDPLKLKSVGLRVGALNDPNLYSFEVRYPEARIASLFSKIFQSIDRTLRNESYDLEINFEVLRDLTGSREEIIAQLQDAWPATQFRDFAQSAQHPAMKERAEKMLSSQFAHGNSQLQVKGTSGIVYHDYRILGLVDWNNTLLGQAIGVKIPEYSLMRGGVIMSTFGDWSVNAAQGTTHMYLERGGFVEALDLR